VRPLRFGRGTRPTLPTYSTPSSIQTSSGGTCDAWTTRKKPGSGFRGGTRWSSESDASWAITPPQTRNAAGYVALRDIVLKFGYAEITYWVRAPFRGRGLATAAVKLVADWALEDVGLHRLEVKHSVKNGPSCAVATNAGFTVEGTARSALLHADGWHDMHVHARVAGDSKNALR
jgi:RimJ/RimL family protein N-acetyltransferase